MMAKKRRFKSYGGDRDVVFSGALQDMSGFASWAQVGLLLLGIVQEKV